MSLLYYIVQTLWVRLDRIPHTRMPVDVLLVQNPPSVPTLVLAYAYCVWRGIFRGHRPRWVIDWHNLGYTMFESPHPNDSATMAFARRAIRGVAEAHERRMAPLADAHLTVTHAMEEWLGENFKVHGKRVRVLHDRPPMMFRPTTVEEQHELFARLDVEPKEWRTSPGNVRRDESGQILEETISRNQFETSQARF